MKYILETKSDGTLSLEPYVEKSVFQPTQDQIEAFKDAIQDRIETESRTVIYDSAEFDLHSGNRLSLENVELDGSFVADELDSLIDLFIEEVLKNNEKKTEEKSTALDNGSPQAY